MGEYEARLLRAVKLKVSIDHPYQHYQCAGQADVLAWPTERGRSDRLEPSAERW